MAVRYAALSQYGAGSEDAPVTVEIRPFKNGDEAGMCIAHERAIKEICSRDYTPAQIAAWTANMVPERYLRLIADHGERFWVIDDSGTIGGFAGWHANHIWFFFIHPEYAGKGLARKLLHAIESDYWAESGESNCLIDSTITAKPFYERMGYSAVKPAVKKLADGTAIDIWHMQKAKP
jgi:putative acetyltransferase